MSLNKLKSWGRPLLLVLGVAAIVALGRSVGWEELSRCLLAAGPWLPLILLLDLSWVVLEGVALLWLLGPSARKIPFKLWLNATLIHYTTMVVLPVGRAGAEVARATILGPAAGRSKAAAGAAMMQATTLVANSLVSLACMSAVLLGVGQGALSTLLLGNFGATLFLGGGMYLMMRRAKIGGFLGQKFSKLAHFGPELDEHFAATRSRHGGAVVLGLVGRSVQTAQYGVILLAVTGQLSVLGTLTAQGIHLVGAGLGDVVPNQVGVTEGAYRVFAAALGLAKTPEKAVAIALVARVSSLGVAGLCALVATLLPKAAQTLTEELGPPVTQGE